LSALIKGVQRYNRDEQDEITLYEKRFAGLKAFLQNHEVVGYVSDYDDRSDDDGMAYAMTQYVLAPTILARGIKRDLIVGNFHRTIPNIKEYQKKNLAPIRDFGNGVILFEKMDH
jgi:hypothetical protein